MGRYPSPIAECISRLSQEVNGSLRTSWHETEGENTGDSRPTIRTAPIPGPCQPGPPLLSYPRAVHEVAFFRYLMSEPDSDCTRLERRQDAAFHAGLPYQVRQTVNARLRYGMSTIEIGW